MKKLIALALIAAMLTGCSHSYTVPAKNGNLAVTYPTYGLVDAAEHKSDKMCYSMSVGNVILAIILIETVVVPLWVVGWELYNPVREKPANGSCNIDN